MIYNSFLLSTLAKAVVLPLSGRKPFSVSSFSHQSFFLVSLSCAWSPDGNEAIKLSRLCFSFDSTKSTKGASKLRRDLINSEIANLRDLLPLPPSTRQRLSQLQLMALVCVYVRKANYFTQGMYTYIFIKATFRHSQSYARN